MRHKSKTQINLEYAAARIVLGALSVLPLRWALAAGRCVGAFAFLVGWLLPQGASPSEHRVLYRGDWKMLGDDGSVEPWQVAA